MSKMINRFYACCAILAALFFSLGTAASADTYESQDHLKDVVKAFITAHQNLEPDETMDVQFEQLSSYTLPTCQSGIVAGLPKDHNSQEITSVELACTAEPVWHVYIPVHVAVYTKVLVAKQTITSQEELTPDNVELGSYEKNRLYSGYFKNTDEVIGQVASLVISPGTVITKKNIQFPIIVRRNQVIEVTVNKNAVSVSMKGIAKTDGALNSTIKVLNTSSQKTFDAVVVGPNRAEILL
jgi:flagella basal body P-ring formation protein FlgA